MIPPQADLGALAGLQAGFQYPNVMIDGGEFVGAKAYKDAKVCNMLTMREFARRYESTGVVFSSLYPGCIAETALFRNHVKAFQFLFPAFQKNITQVRRERGCRDGARALHLRPAAPHPKRSASPFRAT